MINIKYNNYIYVQIYIPLVLNYNNLFLVLTDECNKVICETPVTKYEKIKIFLEVNKIYKINLYYCSNLLVQKTIYAKNDMTYLIKYNSNHLATFLLFDKNYPNLIIREGKIRLCQKNT